MQNLFKVIQTHPKAFAYIAVETIWPVNYKTGFEKCFSTVKVNLYIFKLLFFNL